MNQSLKHVTILAAILLATGLTYSRLPSAYFCAYDDFLEVHRAAFEDTREPAKVFTTTHFTSYKYRPLNRGINLLTYWAGDGTVQLFSNQERALPPAQCCSGVFDCLVALQKRFDQWRRSTALWVAPAC